MKTIKYSVVVIVICCAGMTSLAQKTDTTQIDENYRNEIGMDATWFIKNIIDFGGNSYYTGYSDNSSIRYKRYVSHNKAIRFALGGTYSTRQDTGGYNSNTNYTDKAHKFNALIGFELRNRFSNKWLFYYGIDFLTGYYYSVSHNMGTSYGRPDVISNTVLFGGGPVIGFELILNDRLSLSTESSAYFTDSKQDKEYKYEDAPEHNRQSLHRYSGIGINLPLSVFVKYRF